MLSLEIKIKDRFYLYYSRLFSLSCLVTLNILDAVLTDLLQVSFGGK